MNENNRIIAEGYCKNPGASAEGFTMFAEVQSQVTTAETSTAIVQIRVGVFPESGSLKLDTLRENYIEMSVKQAQEFADSILAEIAEATSEMAEGGSASEEQGQ
jgi:hypothetical protein